MGQYYKPTNLDKLEEEKSHLYSHNFGAGLKIMEHSYIGNEFVGAVEVLLTEFGEWYKCRLIWAGDYADVEPGTEGQGYEGKGENIYTIAGENTLAPYDIDEIKKKNKINLKDYPYIVNHTKKQYVDKNKVKEFEKGWKIHPLPLLTVEGNGRGGGDYKGKDMDNIGVWARDSISVEKLLPKGYKRLTVSFKE